MCTCGIAIATQQHRPAMASSVCSVAGAQAKHAEDGAATGWRAQP